MNWKAKIWSVLTRIYPKYLRWRYKMDIGEDCVISRKAKLDRVVNPQGIHIGKGTWVLAGTCILAHDACRGIKTDTYIGEHCVIGIRTLILPGIHVGNQCVIGRVAS